MRATINALVSAVVTVVLDVAGVPRGVDETIGEDYLADEGDPRVEKRRLEVSGGH